MKIKKSFFYFLFFCIYSQTFIWAYTITPAVVFLELSKSQSSTFLVKNSSNKTILVEAKTFVNEQNSNGVLNSIPTKNLILFPPIVRVPPNSSKKVRINLSPDKENINEQKYYKVLFAMLPEGKSTAPDNKGGSSVSIQVVTAYHVPVYVIPKKPIFSLTLTDLKIGTQDIFFRLKNESNMTLRLIEQEIMVMIDDKWESAASAKSKALPIITGNTVGQSFSCSICKGKKIQAVKLNGNISYWGSFSILKNI